MYKNVFKSISRFLMLYFPKWFAEKQFREAPHRVSLSESAQEILAHMSQIHVPLIIEFRRNASWQQSLLSVVCRRTVVIETLLCSVQFSSSAQFRRKEVSLFILSVNLSVCLVGLWLCVSVCPSVFLYSFLCLSSCVVFCLSVCLSVHLSAVCLSVYLSAVCLTVYLSVCLSVCVSVCRCACMTGCLSICLAVCLCVCISVCLCVSISLLSVKVYVCLSVGMYVYLFTCLSV